MGVLVTIALTSVVVLAVFVINAMWRTDDLEDRITQLEYRANRGD